MRKLRVNMEDLRQAVCRDTSFCDEGPEEAYLDLETSEIHWVYKDNEYAPLSYQEFNRSIRERIKKFRDKVLLLSGMSHGECHEALQAFLDSDWTDDEQEREDAKGSYSGSIGHWKDAVGDAVSQQFQEFLESYALKRIVDLLQERGIELGS